MNDKPKKLTGADRRWGWEFGCDGVVNAAQAAEVLGCTNKWVWRLGEDGKIRRGKRGARNYLYCLRSLREYLRPVEV